MSDLVSQRPTNSAGGLDRNDAGAGILVGGQAPDLSSPTEQARAQSVIRRRVPLQAFTDAPRMIM
ncbi:hypothetical protein ACFC18_34900 [Streptomyces sp. NPDC056121]|uniref:hypothetical protein n=1 Tax=Streptomyces TaxID=1883 RepID=UPI001D09E18A|nr:hypothetical protein [Streptomyces longhuiensis]UDL97309.1 hypothetical protein LGI35_03055 [Streptomyces longhuiensis]